MGEIENAEAIADIAEINTLLGGYSACGRLDRSKAMELFNKQKCKDPYYLALNCPENPTFTPYDAMTDAMMVNSLKQLALYLGGKTNF